MHESSKEANNQYLLEIGLEEMPAGMILPAVEQLKKAAEKSLESIGCNRQKYNRSLLQEDWHCSFPNFLKNRRIGLRN